MAAAGDKANWRFAWCSNSTIIRDCRWQFVDEVRKASGFISSEAAGFLNF
jgi:hypothetical protein